MRYFFAIAAVFVAVLLVFIVLKILPLLTAKPTIKKDYMAEYNKVTKPFDYDPNKNAAPYYKKTFDAFVEMPDTIEDCWQAWPTDLNDTELKIVEDWVASNRDAVSYVNQAAQKPYLWIERQCVDNDMFNFEISELPKLRELVWCISLQAKLSAIHGQPDSALNQLIELHKIGLHYSGPTSLVEQLVLSARWLSGQLLRSWIEKNYRQRL
jgi:hypothetical protein